MLWGWGGGSVAAGLALKAPRPKFGPTLGKPGVAVYVCGADSGAVEMGTSLGTMA